MKLELTGVDSRLSAVVLSALVLHSASTGSAEESSIELIRKHHGIDVRCTLPDILPDGISAKESTDILALRYSRNVFHPELGLYPPGLLKRLGLKTIYVVNDLVVDGTDAAAIVLPEEGSLYIETVFPWRNVYLASTLHHEIYHLIDRKDGHLNDDKKWCALNPKSFTYGEEFDGQDGFFTEYSAFDMAEDKAELFSSLVMFENLVWQKCKTDVVLAKKVALIKQRTAKASSGRCSEAFWERASWRKWNNQGQSFFEREENY